MISRHHDCDTDDHLCSLIATADFVAAAAHPFPRVSHNPVARLVSKEEGGDLLAAAAEFLPSGLLEAVGLETEQLVELARVLTPAIRQHVQDLRDSIRD